MAPRRMNIHARFESKIKKDPLSGCWIWTDYGSEKSYGKFRINGRKGKTWRAHRAAWLIYFGEDPGKKYVLHKCDNTRCVNPEHLFLGTQKENIEDAVNKGRMRQPKGSKSPHSKLSIEQVREIRRRYELGNTSTPKLAEEYGISKSQVWNIISRSQWKDEV